VIENPRKTKKKKRTKVLKELKNNFFSTAHS